MKNKRILSLVLAFAMILGTFSFAFAAAPEDVVDTEYEAAVDRLIQLGALGGYPDGTFKPNNEITREEFAAALIKTKGLKTAAEAAAGLPSGFTDVPATRWSSGYVGLAANLDIVKGIGNNKFAPTNPVKYEQAITMIMRALGYEEAAKAKGGYPVGYLVVASEAGLLDSVNGTQGAPALRGAVAQLLDNALKIPMMVQVSYGDRTEYIVSGTREGVAEKTLLSELGYQDAYGRVTEINESKGFIRIGRNVFYVDEEFDFQEALGLNLKVWYDKLGKVVLYTKHDTPVFDAAMYYKGGLYLPSNGVYDFATDKDGKNIATLILDGKNVRSEDFEADYAKVTFDAYGDVIWAEGFTFDGNIAVEKLDGNVVESYGYEELSLKGYTIVNIDGKTISIDDLEENDIVFYNKDNRFAVVANITVEGTVDKVYTDRFEIAGERYDIDGRYLDGDYMGDLNDGVLASMKKEEKEATVYFDFWENVVLVVGKTAPSTTSSNYFLLLAKSKSWNNPRSGVAYYTLDVLNDEGKVVSYDVKESEINDDYKSVQFIDKGEKGNWEDVLCKDDAVDTILKLSINANDKVTKVEIVENYEVKDLGVTSKYVHEFKLQNNTVIFRPDGNSYSVTTWEKADEEFTKIKSGKYYVGDAGRVAAIFAEDTDAKEAITNYPGRIKDVRTLRNGLKEVDILVEGEEYTFATGPDTVGTAELEKYEMFNLEVVNKTETIKKVTNLEEINAKIEGLRPGSKVIETDKGTFELMDKAVIYTGRVTTLRFADLEIGDYLDVYPMKGGSRFIIYAVKVDGPKAPETTEGVVTYINTPETIKDGKLTLVTGFADQTLDIEYKNDTKELAKLKDVKIYIPGKVDMTAIDVDVNPGETKALELDLVLKTADLAAGTYEVKLLIDGKLQDETLEVIVLDNVNTVKEVNIEGVKATGTYSVQLPLGVEAKNVTVKATDITLNSAKAKVIDLTKVSDTSWTFDVEAESGDKLGTQTITLVPTVVTGLNITQVDAKTLTFTVEATGSTPVKGLTAADFVVTWADGSGTAVDAEMAVDKIVESTFTDGEYKITFTKAFVDDNTVTIKVKDTTVDDTHTFAGL